MRPRIVRKPEMRLVGMRGRFTKETTREIPGLWGRFAPRMASVPGRVDANASYGACRMAPADAEGPSAFEYAACVEVSSLDRVPDGMVGFAVPAATYAVFTHTGPIATIGETWDAIHERWLAEAGLESAGSWDFERYDERWDPRTASGPVDVHVAVKPSTRQGPSP
jgi:AraC family transcriptional regulator